MDGGRGREWGARADRGLDEAWGGVKDEVSSGSEARQPTGKARGSSLRWGESSRKAADSQSAGAVNDEAHVGTTWSRQGSHCTTPRELKLVKYMCCRPVDVHASKQY